MIIINRIFTSVICYDCYERSKEKLRREEAAREARRSNRGMNTYYLFLFITLNCF